MTQLISGIEREPFVAVGYGVPGVGKTTLGAGAPGAVLVGPERNKSAKALKFPQTQSHDQLMQYLHEIEQGKHDRMKIKTVVVDSIDMHEKVIWKEITGSEPGKTMATARKGFGKAYEESFMRLTEVRDHLDSITKRKEFNIFVLGHSVKTKFSDPILAIEYDTYEMCLHQTKRKDHNAIFTDWASMVLFLNWRSYATEEGNFATSMGKREIRTEDRPSHLAKNRYNLPETIEMDMVNPENTFNIIMWHIDNFYAQGAQANTAVNDLSIVMKEAKALMAQVTDPAILPTIEAALIASQNNFSEIKVIKDRLYQIVSNQ